MTARSRMILLLSILGIVVLGGIAWTWIAANRPSADSVNKTLQVGVDAGFSIGDTVTVIVNGAGPRVGDTTFDVLFNGKVGTGTINLSPNDVSSIATPASKLSIQIPAELTNKCVYDGSMPCDKTVTPVTPGNYLVTVRTERGTSPAFVAGSSGAANGTIRIVVPDKDRSIGATAISPTTFTVAEINAGATMTVTGSGFGATTTVAWDSSTTQVKPSKVSASSLEVPVLTSNPTLGTHSIYVRTGESSYGGAYAGSFTVTDPARPSPVILTSVTSSMTIPEISRGIFNLSLRGSGFTSQSKIQFEGPSVPVDGVNAGLYAPRSVSTDALSIVPPFPTPLIGTHKVRVVDPVGSSDWVSFTIRSAPTLLSISPTNFTVSDVKAGKMLTLTGTGFTDKTRLVWNHPASEGDARVQPLSFSPTEMKVAVLSGWPREPLVGMQSVHITEDDGKLLGFDAKVFYVNPDPTTPTDTGSTTTLPTDTGSTTTFKPTLTSVAPLRANAGGTITLTGTGLAEDNSINLNGPTQRTLKGNGTATSQSLILPSDLPEGKYAVQLSNKNGRTEGLTLTVLSSTQPKLRSVSGNQWLGVTSGSEVILTGTGFSLYSQVVIADASSKDVATIEAPRFKGGDSQQLIITVPTLRKGRYAVRVVNGTLQSSAVRLTIR